MKTTMKLMSLLMALLAWLMPLDAFSANMTGDVNTDGEVNIADVNAVINIILTDASDLRGDVNHDGEVNIADINAVISIILGGNEEPEYECVDLGLPSGTLWATMNVGASSPEQYGDHFAWGETEPKEYYDWNSYKWGSYLSGEGIKKYVTNSEYGTVDNKIELDPEDDAAFVNWGPSWRMPTMEQMKELFNNCTWQWTTINGVNGQLATGPNGNTLFFPAAGSYEYSSVIFQGGDGDYWTRSLRNDLSLYAHCLHFYYGGMTLFDNTREAGFSVRAVHMPPTEFRIEQQSLDLGVVPIGETRTGELTIVNNTDKAVTLTVTTDGPFSFQQDESTTSNLTIVLPGNSRDTVTVTFTSSTPGEFNTRVTFQNDEGKIGIPVHALAFKDIVPQDECVDLGLPSGTLWATMNVGASSPEQYGDYFAWGETEPKEYYDWSNYKWCNGTYQSLTKYCNKRDYGTIDNKTKLELEDDAAYVNWGPSWRMPDKSQFDELKGKCTWLWTPRNGVNGYLVIGPNGNSLFLPAPGLFADVSYQDGLQGYYWSRDFYTGNSVYSSAFSLSFDAQSATSAAALSVRAYGISVRPVRVSPANSQGLHIEQQSLELAEAHVGDLRTGELTVINNSTNAVTLTATADEPFLLKHDENGVSSITIEVPAKSCAPLMVMFTGTVAGEFNGNVTIQSAELEGGQTVIPIHASAYEDFPDDEWVDLGLPSGTLWATRNIGADTPIDNGDYFAWGETDTKNVYNWSTYKWCDGGPQAITKYCVDSALGTVDNKTELDPEDDAAYVNWGPSWRTPSKEQLIELLNYCTWTWTTLHGVKGYLVTGPNDNTMFLPAAGHRANSALSSVGNYGEYWLRDLDWSYTGNAFQLYFTWSVAYDSNYLRCFGCTIRPVRLPTND